jgi:hypothetical protein
MRVVLNLKGFILIYREGRKSAVFKTTEETMNPFENIHSVLATACEKHEIGMAELCRYHKRLHDILAQYDGGRLADAAYHEAELLNDEINQRFSPMMRLERERAMPGLGLAEQPWHQA